MDEIQQRVADALRTTKPDPYTQPQSFKQWQRMAHALNAAVHIERLPHDTAEFLFRAGMTNARS